MQYYAKLYFKTSRMLILNSLSIIDIGVILFSFPSLTDFGFLGEL